MCKTYADVSYTHKTHSLSNTHICTHTNYSNNSLSLSPGVFTVRSYLEVKFGINPTGTSVIRARNIKKRLHWWVMSVIFQCFKIIFIANLVTGFHLMWKTHWEFAEKHLIIKTMEVTASLQGTPSCWGLNKRVSEIKMWAWFLWFYTITYFRSYLVEALLEASLTYLDVLPVETIL